MKCKGEVRGQGSSRVGFVRKGKVIKADKDNTRKLCQRKKRGVPLGRWHGWQAGWGAFNTCSMGDKQEELEATVLQESYHLVALLELGGMNPMTEVSLLIATASSADNGRKERWDCPQHQEVDSMWGAVFEEQPWARQKPAGKNQCPRQQRNLVVGIYYRLPDEGDPTDKGFFLKLQEALCSQAFVLLEGFNHCAVEILS